MPVIKNARLDLWFESLIISEDDYHAFWMLLNENERTKAMRFTQECEHRRYVASHAKLRKILANYLQLPPEQIVFATQSHGKPFVVSNAEHSVKFNLSHSGDYLAIAISRDCDIGVDIEEWSENMAYESILERCFADCERRFWSSLSQEEKKEFFYKQWTRKESFVKAVGSERFALNVAQVITTSTISKGSRFISIPSGQGLPENWSLIDLKLAKGLSGAVTISNASDPIITYRCLL